MFLWTVLSLFCIIKYILHLTTARCKSIKNLTGKTILITGGNSGLGLELAKNVASRGCTTIIADKTDGAETVRKLIKESNNEYIFYEFVDFTSFKSVRTFAEEFKNKYKQLDVLVNNAGVGNAMGKTEDGLEATMQINYFSHFLLTHLLLDVLLKTPHSRIIFTSSIAGYVSNLNKENLKCYIHAALAMMSKTLAHKLRGTGVTVNAHHPGMVKTNIVSSMNKDGASYFIKFIQFLFWLWGMDTDSGVQTMLHLVTSDEDTTAEFFMNCKPFYQPPIVCNDKLRDTIWNLSEVYVNLKQEEKVDTVLNMI
ncbi:hypothetical protein GWI33_000701 [Rhynchophorus ferrugineus]|uniref:Uncharacterized protein n=1 Tax=Rhynchophorus ferrugineus TaxID=354439 RepID=A0A834LYN3_RHYFE|nr:hypothetical protein GWI33_000701 [Rhynchophorus ferrugineus]